MRYIPSTLVAVLLVTLTASGAVATERLHGIHYDPPRHAPDLKGLDHRGQPWIFHRQPHPLALVLFGYVNCVDVCPTNLIRITQVKELLGEDADQVLVVFVTIDPEYETPEILAERLDYFGGEIIGLTGDIDDLAPAWTRWNVVRSKQRIPVDEDPTGRGYKFDHTAMIHLVQGGRRLRASYPYGTEAETMVEDLRLLLDDPDFEQPRLPPVGSVREVVLPAGSYTLSFQKDPSIPTYIRLHAGDTLRWVNDDYMYHFIGDVALAPGDRASITYDEPGDTYYLCTATPGEALRVHVVERDEADATNQNQH